MKHVVSLEGKKFALKYTLSEREELEGMFPRPDGTPGSLGLLVRFHLATAGSFAVQRALLWAGLRHLGPKWTLDRVGAALDKASQNGGMGDALRECGYAIFASGVLGKVVERPAEDVEAEEAEEGKEEPPTPTT